MEVEDTLGKMETITKEILKMGFDKDLESGIFLQRLITKVNLKVISSMVGVNSILKMVMSMKGSIAKELRQMES